MRSTGSGMGCPDWPKCFGQLVPPTSASELPEDYKEQYSKFRQGKNERFAAMLNVFGYSSVAEDILNDPSILIEEDFNVYKTWTEYINRLIGAITGLFILGLFVYSVSLWQYNKTFVLVAGATVVITAFQGWLGSIVVSTNLLSWLVSAHMFIAFLIIACVLYLNRSLSEIYTEDTKKRFPYAGMLVFCIFLLLVQVFFGVEVREMLDVVAKAMSYENRSSWIENVGETFYLHRSFSLFVFAFNFFTVWKIRNSAFGDSFSRKTGYALIGFLVGEIFLGIVMAYFAIPVFAQPLHLVLAVLIFSTQFILLLHFSGNKKLRSELFPKQA